MNAHYNYKFSVIIPIYNVEAYLRETIDSVLNQTIGFEDNIQLILVNDGSKDSSGLICEEYLRQYPENIVYVDKKNQGVSATRNAGIKYIQGKYVNFFDSDDIWSEDAFANVWDFFEKHYEEVDLVCGKEMFFEMKSGPHNLNYKFEKGDRIIDIRKEPECILLSVKAAFIKKEIAGTVRFDERLSVGEDAKYLTDIILRKEKYGVMDSVVYNFRKRQANTSITQNRKIGRYTDTIDLYYKYVLDYSEEKYGYLLPYAQHVALNGLKVRVSEKQRDFMSAEQWTEYANKVVTLVKRMDDEVIGQTRNVNVFNKISLLNFKYGNEAEKDIFFKDGKYMYGNLELVAVPQECLTVTNINVRESGKEIVIKGFVKAPLNDKIHISAYTDGRQVSINTYPEPKLKKVLINGDIAIRGYGFECSMELSGEKIATIEFFLECAEEKIPLNIAYGKRISKASVLSAKEFQTVLNDKYIQMNYIQDNNQ